MQQKQRTLRLKLHNRKHRQLDKERKKKLNRNKTSHLKCILINARSIINKKEEIEALAYEKDPDIILITETWAKDKHSIGEVSLRGYDCHRNDRTHTERGGGCIIYAKSSLKTVVIENLTNTANTDTVWCKHEDITIGVCYNTTANNVEEEEPLLQLMTTACNLSGEAVIVGDFNHETIDWEILEANAEGQRFLDTTGDLFLTQHVTEPTRGRNTMDLVCSTNPSQISNCKVTEKLATSDHNMVEFEIGTKQSTTSWKTKYRDYRKADYNKVRAEIQTEEYTHNADESDT